MDIYVCKISISGENNLLALIMRKCFLCRILLWGHNVNYNGSFWVLSISMKGENWFVFPNVGFKIRSLGNEPNYLFGEFYYFKLKYNEQAKHFNE